MARSHPGPVVEIRVLGPTEVRLDATPVSGLAPKARAVATVLALRAGSAVSVEELIGAVWANHEPRVATKALQMYVSNLRKVLPPGVLDTVAGGYRLRVAASDVDALAFAQAVETAAGRLEHDPGGVAEMLEAALELWRGSTPIVDLPDGEWASREASRLGELRRRGEEQLADARLALGEHDSLIAELAASVAVEPLREHRWAQLITALYRCNRQADALRAYQRLRAVLADQLGVDPSPPLQALEVAVLTHDRSLDLGGPSTHPASSTGSSSSVGADSATVTRGVAPPRSLSRLVGRGDELAAIVRALKAGRVVTLRGIGGVGKTRLAGAVAQALAHEYGDRVGWADLAGLSDPSDVVPVAADALGVSGQPGRPLLDQVCAAMAGRQMLAVVDNCEHVRAAAAELVAALAERCDGVAVLATSRERIGVDGEVVIDLAPLPVAGRDSPAVELLAERIGGDDRRPEDDGRLVEIAKQLDGLPLALELAAARCRSLGVAEVADRLSGHLALLADPGRRTARHRTLEATLSWSYQLLSPPERYVLRRLSVFAASFVLDAAEEVAAGPDVASADVAGHVASLVDKSLVMRDGHRFRLLETTRQYAAACLAESGDASDAFDAHRAYVVRRARTLGAGLHERDERESVLALAAEWPDVRAVARRALDGDDPGTLTEVLVHLVLEFFYRRPEAFTWVTEAAARYGERPSPHRHELLGAAALVAFTVGDMQRAIEIGERAMAADPAPGTALGCLPQNATLGAYYFTGDFDTMGALAARTLEVLGPDQPSWVRARVLGSLALARFGQGAQDAAVAAVDAADRESRDLGPSAISYNLMIRAYITADTDPAAAAKLFDESAAMAASVGNQWLSRLYGHRAVAASLAGRPDPAALGVCVEAVDGAQRDGWIIHAWGLAWAIPVLLWRLGHRREAATVLGACRASGALPAVNWPVPPELAALADGQGDAELMACVAAGADLTLPELLRVAASADATFADQGS